MPTPRTAARFDQDAPSTAGRLPKRVMTSRATSTALLPPAPVPSSRPSNSASDNAAAPRAHRRSRGRSASDQGTGDESAREIAAGMTLEAVLMGDTIP